MTANVTQLQNRPLDTNAIEGPEAAPKVPDAPKGGVQNPEAAKALQETRELLRDIYSNYAQIPNPSDEVKAKMETVTQRLAALSEGAAVLTEQELDSLCNVGEYVNDPLPAMLDHIDECRDYDSVDTQVKKAREELVRTYDNNGIDAKRLAEGLDSLSQKGDYVRARIEKQAIEDNEKALDFDKATPEEIASHMENLRTVIADAKFIDFHTKCEMMENLNEIIRATEVKENPSESTSKFLKKMAERRQEQERLMNEAVQNRHREDVRNEQNVQQKQSDSVNKEEAPGEKKAIAENLIRV